MRTTTGRLLLALLAGSTGAALALPDDTPAPPPVAVEGGERSSRGEGDAGE